MGKYRKNSRAVGNRYGRNYRAAVGNFVATGAKYAAKRGLSYLRDRMKKTKSGIETTGQYDYKLQYVKKNMPRKMKSNWKKFVSKVHAATMKLVGTNTVVKNTVMFSSTSLANTQTFVTAHLYGMNGTDANWEVGCGDIQSIDTLDNRIGPNTKVMFGSAVLDLTIKNTSEGSTPVEADLYEIIYYDEMTESSFLDAENACQVNTPSIGAGANLALFSRGATLFDLPGLIKYGKIKILKKTKLFLPGGNTATYQIRDSRNHRFNANDFADMGVRYVKRGVTKSVVIVFKPVVASGNSCRLDVGVTRKYAYKIFEDNADADAYTL